ncbi:MAG TPA: hypothetical protein VFH45_10405 [Acidimicrobiales bacterium]|nr:hypothetical protein [Acidimicrobiales bacterium]
MAPTPHGPHRSRYLLAFVLIVGALALAVGFGFGGGRTRSDQAVGFARFPVPSQFTFHVARPATYYVYSEGTACLDFPDCHGEIYPVTVTVRAPSGQAVEVEATQGPTYMIGGGEGTGVARFDAAAPGDYRIAVSTGPYAEGRVAVGEGFAGWTQDWVARAAMVVLLVAAAAVILVPLMRRRRQEGSHAPMA